MPLWLVSLFVLAYERRCYVCRSIMGTQSTVTWCGNTQSAFVLHSSFHRPHHYRKCGYPGTVADLDTHCRCIRWLCSQNCEYPTCKISVLIAPVLVVFPSVQGLSNLHCRSPFHWDFDLNSASATCNIHYLNCTTGMVNSVLVQCRQSISVVGKNGV